MIGNPPYGMEQAASVKRHYERTCNFPEGRFDMYEVFPERSVNLFNDSGIMSFIIPNTILSNLYSKKLRSLLIQDFELIEIVNFGMDVFDDPTVHTCILSVTRKGKSQQNETQVKKQVNSIPELVQKCDYLIFQNKFLASDKVTFDIFFDPKDLDILNKIQRHPTFGEICYIRQCIKTGDDKVYVKEFSSKLDSLHIPVKLSR